MTFDTDNEVVKLCAEGMAAEASGEMAQAKSFFLRAWEHAESDFEKFIAAHYVARHQERAEETLHWNVLALTHAQQLGDESLKMYLPSLYLNIGKSYEDLNRKSDAIANYKLAEQNSIHLSTDAYGDMIRFGIKGALKRMRV